MTRPSHYWREDLLNYNSLGMSKQGQTLLANSLCPWRVGTRELAYSAQKVPGVAEYKVPG